MNHRFFFFLFGIISLSIIVSGCQGPRYSPSGVRLPPVFDEWDLNKDGRVTQGEVVRYRTVRFNSFDRDKNGIWSREEFNQYCRVSRRSNPDCRKPDSYFIELDWKMDGVISRKEFIEFDPPLFIELDRNGDGVITPKELQPKTPAIKREDRDYRPGRRRRAY